MGEGGRERRMGARGLEDGGGGEGDTDCDILR